MKIGIVTFFKAINYGAMLQAYALMRYLENRGHKVQFVAHERLMTERIPFWRCFLRLNKRELRNRLSRFFQFEIVQFADIMPQTCFSRNFNELVDSCKSFDAVIVGSDQMWNPMWCAQKYLPLVMLDFVNPKAKRISYAVSFATDIWPKSCNKELAGNLLRKFYAISVREESGVDLVREISMRNDACCLIDPTLLHTESFYRQFIDGSMQSTSSGQPYIFEYVLDEWGVGPVIEHVEMAVKELTQTSTIMTDKMPPKNLCGSLLFRHLGVTSKISVAQWIKSVANAKFVITNSFHGTVFAILFHRPFVVMPLEGRMATMNCRIMSLLNLLGISSRVVKGRGINDVRIALFSDLNWADVDKRLCSLRLKTDWYFNSLGI